jgi:hypothetical protein
VITLPQTRRNAILKQSTTENDTAALSYCNQGGHIFEFMRYRIRPGQQIRNPGKLTQFTVREAFVAALS